MHCVIETPSFENSAKASGISDQERHEITTFVAENPLAGDLIKGTGGARKLRMPMGNRGKSGGVRIVTYFAGEDIPVFLLDVFKKGDKINLSHKERNELKSILADMADNYRARIRAKVADLKEKAG